MPAFPMRIIIKVVVACSAGFFLSSPSIAEPSSTKPAREINRQGNSHSAQRNFQNSQRSKAQQSSAQKRKQRLSAEERSQLRSDIKNAGQEIYLPRK